MSQSQSLGKRVETFQIGSSQVMFRLDFIQTGTGESDEPQSVIIIIQNFGTFLLLWLGKSMKTTFLTQ